jgi:hypothetical protein
MLTVDGIAKALGIDDGDRARLRYVYRQRKGKRREYGVEVLVEHPLTAMTADQQFIECLRECLGLEPLYGAGNIFRERSKRAYATRERRGKLLRRYRQRKAMSLARAAENPQRRRLPEEEVRRSRRRAP